MTKNAAPGAVHFAPEEHAPDQDGRAQSAAHASKRMGGRVTRDTHPFNVDHDAKPVRVLACAAT